MKRGHFKVTSHQIANNSEINRRLTLRVCNYWDKKLIFPKYSAKYLVIHEIEPFTEKKNMDQIMKHS